MKVQVVANAGIKTCDSTKFVRDNKFRVVTFKILDGLKNRRRDFLKNGMFEEVGEGIQPGLISK